jgi:ribosome-binding protein aMBF1 (putative translation factor)
VARFGHTPRRLALLSGLKAGLDALRAAGCRRAYLDGSFVTAKEAHFGTPPGDFDACWETAGVDFPALGRGGGAVPRLFPARQADRRPAGDRRHRPGGFAMIGNEREYRSTAAAIGRFEAALDRLEREGPERHPLLQQAVRESMAGEVQALREQVAEYDALRGGKVAVLEADSLRELPDALIRARIAAGLTQKALAARLGLKEQQIQRYEATRYASANLARIQAVADALGVRIHERIVLPAADK